MGNIIDDFKKRRADRLNEKAISAYKSRRDARMAEKNNFDDKWITIGASKGGSFVDENGNRVEEKPHKGIHILVSENGIAKGGAGGQFNGQDFSKAKSLPPEAGLEKMKAEEKAEKAKKEGKVEEAKAQEAKAQEIENETATSPVEEQKEVTGENISPKEESLVEPAEEVSENSFQTPDEFQNAKSEGGEKFKSYLESLPVGAGFIFNNPDGSAKLKKIDDDEWEFDIGEQWDNPTFSDSEVAEQWGYLAAEGDITDMNSGEVLQPHEEVKSNLEKFQSAVETMDKDTIKEALKNLNDKAVFGVIVNGDTTYFKKNNGFFNGYSDKDQDWVTWGGIPVENMAKIISESKNLEGVDITSSPDDNKKPVEEEVEGNIGDFVNTIVEDKEAGLQMMQEMPEGTEIEFTDESGFHNFIKKNEDGSWDAKVDDNGVVTHYEDVGTDTVAGLIHNGADIKVNNSGEGKEAEETNPENAPFGGEPETDYDLLGQDIENKLVTAEKGDEIVPLMDKIQVGDTLRYFDEDVEINATKNEDGSWNVTFNGEYPENNVSSAVLAGAMMNGEISGVKISKGNQAENAQENSNQEIQENEQPKETGKNQEFVKKLANLTDEDDVEGVVEDYLSSLPVGAVIISHDGHGLWTYTKTGNTWKQENQSGAKVEGSYSDDIAHWVALGYIGGNPIIDGQSGKTIAYGWGIDTPTKSGNKNANQEFAEKLEKLTDKAGVYGVVNDYISSLPVGAVIKGNNGVYDATYTKTGDGKWKEEYSDGVTTPNLGNKSVAYGLANGYNKGKPIIDGKTGEVISYGWGEEAPAKASKEQKISDGLSDLQEAVNNKEGIDVALANLEPNEVFGISGYTKSLSYPDGIIYAKKGEDGKFYYYSLADNDWIKLDYGDEDIQDAFENGKTIKLSDIPQNVLEASNSENKQNNALEGLSKAVESKNKGEIEQALADLQDEQPFGIPLDDNGGFIYYKKKDGKFYYYNAAANEWKPSVLDEGEFIVSPLSSSGKIKTEDFPEKIMNSSSSNKQNVSQGLSMEKEFESKLKDAMGSPKNITNTENILKTAGAGTIVTTVSEINGSEIKAKKESDGTWTVVTGDHIMLDTSDNQVAAMLADHGVVNVNKWVDTASNPNSGNQQQSAPKTENGISYESIAQNLKEYKSQLNPSDFKDELKAMDEGSTINATIGGNDVTLTKNPSGNGWEGSDGNHYSSTTIANKVMQGSIGVNSIGNGKGWSMSLNEKAPEQKKIEFTEETSKAANSILKEYNEQPAFGKKKPITKAKKLVSSAVDGSTLTMNEYGGQSQTKFIKDNGQWYKVKDDGTTYPAPYEDEEIAYKIKNAKNSEFFGALDTTPKSKILNVSNNMTAQQKEFIQKNAGKGSAATYHQSPPSKNNVVFNESEFSDSAKSKAVWGAHGLDDNKIIQQLKPKFDEAWANLSQAEKNAVKEYTGNYSKYNEPMYGVKYSGQKNSSMQTINALTSAISKSVIDKPQYVDHYCGIATINGMLKFGGHNTINSGDYESLVGKEIVNSAFTSGACADGSGYKKDRPFKLHIYLPKGTQTFFAEPISSFGTSEFETIIQRGSHYKVTGVTKNHWGQITVNCELVSQDPKPYNIINGVAIYG